MGLGVALRAPPRPVTAACCAEPEPWGLCRAVAFRRHCGHTAGVLGRRAGPPHSAAQPTAFQYLGTELVMIQRLILFFFAWESFAWSFAPRLLQKVAVPMSPSAWVLGIQSPLRLRLTSFSLGLPEKGGERGSRPTPCSVAQGLTPLSLPTALPPGAPVVCGAVPGDPVRRPAPDVHLLGQRPAQSQAVGAGPPVRGSGHRRPSPGQHLHRAPPREEERDWHAPVGEVDPR